MLQVVRAMEKYGKSVSTRPRVKDHERSKDISDMDPVKLQSTFTPDFDREKGKAGSQAPGCGIFGLWMSWMSWTV